MTGSTHANHRSARSPRPTSEGPARDNPVAGPQTGTTQSNLSAPARTGASGRRNEPGSRPASACCAQLPSRSGGESPWGGEGRHSVGSAGWSTESDRTGRGATHHAGPRRTPERHGASRNQGARTDAKQQRPPGAANPDSAHNTQRTTAQEQVPGNTSCRRDGRLRAQQRTQPLPAKRKPRSGWTSARPAAYPAPAGYETAAVRKDVLASGGYEPLQATKSRCPDGQVRAPQRRPAHAMQHTQRVHW